MIGWRHRSWRSQAPIGIDDLVRNLWAAGKDTRDMSIALMVPEHWCYAVLAKMRDSDYAEREWNR